MASSSNRTQPEDGGLRRWKVASGILSNQQGVLLVENQRRGRGRDWSPPGGVVESNEQCEEALTREVAEETGLAVTRWSAPVYHVEVIAPDLGFHLEVETRAAEVFSGEITIDDPDRIVIAARFVPTDGARKLLRPGPRWVGEPLMAYLDGNCTPGQRFAYRADGTKVADLTVTPIVAHPPLSAHPPPGSRNGD